MEPPRESAKTGETGQQTLTRDLQGLRDNGAKMFIIECAAAALITIALGILIDDDTRDTRIRLSHWDELQSM